jgi:uncharacterized protein (TIGR00269 family)
MIMDVEKKVFDTIKKYGLFGKKDKVVVALSGGKDSTSILYILKKAGYDVHGLMIDLYLGEWSEIHKKNMLAFCKDIDVPLKVVDLKAEIGQGICFVKVVLAKKKGMTGCSVCGIVKRWILNRWAKKMGADVIVTGHNLDDEAQNVLMNFLKGNMLLGIRAGPKTGDGELGMKDRGGFAQRVKPLFFVPEGEVRKYAEGKKFEILYDRCPCAFGTYRVDTRDWMKILSDDEKLKIVQGWLAELGNRKWKVGDGELVVCEKCGEPSAGNVCKACGIFECL